jgi:hypothetical protein
MAKALPYIFIRRKEKTTKHTTQNYSQPHITPNYISNPTPQAILKTTRAATKKEGEQK